VNWALTGVVGTIVSRVARGRVFTYVVTHDSGFAPHPFRGLLTLACCKPQIRRTADVGDLVVGLSSRCERVVYAMQVAEIVDFEEYWADPRYRARRPAMDSERTVDRRGDNIYEPVVGGFRQLRSEHCKGDGCEDADLKRTDLSAPVLVADRYTYWGSRGPALPEDLGFLAVGRGHRCRFSEEQVDRVAVWFETLPRGVHGAPAMWPESDESWRER
jgi:hypothetical protein